MGTLTSVLATAVQTGYALDDYARYDAEQQYDERRRAWERYREAQARNADEQRRTAADTARAADIRAGLASGDARRRDALRRSVAAQRARLGARGISTESGSGEALLLGLVDQAAMDRADAEAEARRSLDAIATDRHWRRRRNLIDSRGVPGRRTMPSSDFRKTLDRTSLQLGILGGLDART